MKRNLFKLTFLIAAILSMVLLLSACSNTKIDVSTSMNISDASFSGTRVMTTGGIKPDNITAKLSAAEFAETVVKKAPDGMEVTYEKKDGAYYFKFTIEFSSLDDYTKKVEKITGKKPAIEFDTSDTAFSSRIKFTEDFTSEDLLSWIETAAKELSSKIEIEINYKATDMNYQGQTFTSSKKGQYQVNSISEQTLLTSIEITTYVLGLDNYSRAVTFRMPQAAYEAITQEKFDAIVPSGAVGKPYIDSDAEDKNKYIYQITYSGTTDDIAQTTEKIFPGSKFTCSSTDMDSAAFTINSVISEKIDFTKYPCSSNGTSDATIIYSTGFIEEAETGGAPSGSAASSAFNADYAKTDGTGVSISKKNLGEITVKCDDSAEASVAIPVKFVYGIQNITVDTTLTGNNNLKVAILLDYDINASEMALDLAKNYFSSKFEGIDGVKLDSSKKIRKTETSEQEYYQLKIVFEGSDKKVSESMTKVFGAENDFTNRYKKKFEFSTKHNISQTININELLDYANYKGAVTYTFRSKSATFKGAVCQLYKEDGQTDGTPINDLLNSKTKIGAFTVSAAGGSFRMSFQASYVNVGYIIFIVFIIIVAVVGSTILISLIARKSKAHKQVETEIFRKATVERSLSLAVIQNTDGTIVPLSSQALANRPGAVVDSKRDDGLDEDDDESETIWLFSTTLKLLSLIAGVLFFFPFISVSCSNWAGDQSISAFQLMIGFSRDDYKMDPMPEISLLLIIPLVIFMLLFLWNKLPKFPSAIAIIIASAACLLILLNMEAIIEERIDSMVELTNDRGAVTSFKMKWAYSYSIVVYIMLLIGSVVLLLAEISDKVRKKFK